MKFEANNGRGDNKHNRIKDFAPIACIVILGLFIIGCNSDNITPDNPFGFDDPNAIQSYFDAGYQAGLAAQAVGVAIGNPALIGFGLLMTVVFGNIGINLIKGKK